jgi:hypothetical protein
MQAVKIKALEIAQDKAVTILNRFYFPLGVISGSNDLTLKAETY